MKRCLLAITIALTLASQARADLATGLAKFGSGEFEAAERELQMPAEKGDPRAQYALGIIYLNGYVDPPASGTALELIRTSAENGHLQAQTELARMYRDGDGVAVDFQEMVKWYRRAAEQGDVGAQLFLADSYAYGQGIEVDLVQAYMWYEIAIQYWGPLAVRARDIIAEDMSPEQITQAVRLAGKWFKDRGG